LSDEHLWADKYSGRLEDVFDIQEQISRKIVDALKMKLSSQEDRRLSERPVTNIRAFECYHRARTELYKFTEEGLNNAIRLIQTGLSIVGDNEFLYAALGTVYWQYVNAAIPTEADYLDKAEECGRKAFALNPESAAGHQVIGLVQYHRGQRQEALRTLKRANAIEPNNVFVLGELCRIYFLSGKMTAARGVDAHVQALDPLTPITQVEGLVVEFFAGSPEWKLEPALQFLQINPEFAMLRVLCALVLIHQGKNDEARVLVESAPEERTPSISGRQCVFIRHALSGDRAQARAAVSDALKAAARRVEYWSWVMARCYMLIDEHEQALDWLALAIDRGFINYPFLSQFDKGFAPLRGDPRFEALMQKAKFEFERFEV
jgi:tetratricopeptide (TPR) repeat protein